ncbi:heme NO-binding domain-containing protein [Cognatishimia sp. F0-27]|uniref:heme NO-binding domain-containing protein n=1 Tax=Cognatishimia sp. F0-27 TaxID=2816855 RepID=UPI001D0C8B54|nr:heme NO-binding domain-containing protein [Cognatishimia sp. F0-27]MCC1492173.1 heme NO-binding domain-containing protein [Cognatishimia sp. F0-27]
MHGLILRTFEMFVRDTHGQADWERLADNAELGTTTFEAMLHYEPQVFDQLLSHVPQELGKPPEAFLEDLGLYLVSHPNCEGLRRLLRFGGVDFIDFLHSLDELPDRTRLAVSDLDLPDLELREHGPAHFSLRIGEGLPGFGHVLVGLLRAMADDYGTLALLDYSDGFQGAERIEITLVETSFAEGRSFDLAGSEEGGTETRRQEARA